VRLVIFESGIIKSPRSWRKNRGAPEPSVVESAKTQCSRNKTVLVVMGVVVPRKARVRGSNPTILIGETMSLGRTGHDLFSVFVCLRKLKGKVFPWVWFVEGMKEQNEQRVIGGKEKGRVL